jgi:chaperonin GroEL (HSP60 family)
MAASNGSGRAPVTIMANSTRVTSGIDVHQKLMTAALALGNILRGTFGPRGLDKMMYKTNGVTAVTNDGAKIISELLVKHPAARAFVSLGQAQESACGDGVTGCILFAAELMRESSRLLRKGLHPLIIIEGWRKALNVALQTIESSSNKVNKDTLVKVAATSLVGKGAEGAVGLFSELVVEATTLVSNSLDDEEVKAEHVMMAIADRGTLSDSRLIDGIIIQKRTANEKVPRSIDNVIIALLSCPLEFEGPSRDSEIEVTSPEQLSAFIEAGQSQLENIAELVQLSGCNAVLTTGACDPRVLHKLSEAGIFILADVDVAEISNVAKATGAKVVDLLRDLTETDLGTCRKLRVERREGVEAIEERIIISGCESPKMVTLEIGGANGIATEEVIRGLHDSLKATTLAMRTSSIINGGGHIHCLAALDIRASAEGVAGRERLAMESFARALETIPFTLAINAGKDGLDAILELRAGLRQTENKALGITSNGQVGSVEEVWIPAASLSSAILGAFETTSSLLRVDQVISARGD